MKVYTVTTHNGLKSASATLFAEDKRLDALRLAADQVLNYTGVPVYSWEVRQPITAAIYAGDWDAVETRLVDCGALVVGDI
jgi:hypothetical protein